MWFSSSILSIMFDQVPFKMFLSFLFYIFLFLISLSIKLITEVREEGVYVLSYPHFYSFRSIPFKNIRSYEVRNLSRFWDYDRGGFRYGLNGDTYNLGAKKGLYIEYIIVGRTKSRIVIGSKDPEKLAEAIRKCMQRQTSL
jgi:hypothetical protein